MILKPQSFTVAAPGRLRALSTEAKIAAAFDPTQPPAGINYLKFVAIWDTGATNTVITANVVAACGLKPVGMTKVHTAGGIRDSEVYLVNVALPNGVGFAGVRVTKGDIGTGADVLIGMDIIGTGDFAVTNAGGKTVFSFRYPSVEHIDFVKQSAPAVGRNDPCPCGSGRKYKKCHGAVVPPSGIPSP
jgi:SEC-C motif/gag-polyprotein putative aspartyl protease